MGRKRKSVGIGVCLSRHRREGKRSEVKRRENDFLTG